MMQYFSIGPLLIEIERTGHEFIPFFTETLNRVPDVSIEFTNERPDFFNTQFIARIGNIDVLKYIKQDDNFRWLFAFYHKGCFKASLSISSNYQKASYYCVLEPINSGYYDYLNYILQPCLSCVAIMKGIVVFHAACIYKDDQAIAFSGNSGIGKSTRSNSWVEQLQFEWLSGDRPWIDSSTGNALGTPWDGKEKIHINHQVPLRSIVEVKRSKITKLHKMTESDKLNFVSSQTFLPMWDPLLVAKGIINIKEMLKHVPVDQLYCDMTSQAVFESYFILAQKYGIFSKEIPDMRIKDSFEIVEIGDDYMAIPTGDLMEEFGGTVVLNEVSAFLLNHMKKDITQEELVNILIEEYEVNKETAAKDISNIVAKFAEIGLLED